MRDFQKAAPARAMLERKALADVSFHRVGKEAVARIWSCGPGAARLVMAGRSITKVHATIAG